MRSAVSAILSAPAPESNMSHPDYRQTAHDHASLLVLVRQIGSKLNSRTFSRLYERITRQNTFRIKDSLGNVRIITTRYVRSYPVENNEWGDFQTHRRVLGLICIGECSSTQEVSELCRIHESLRVKFNNTLYDSRCMFLGLDHDGTPYNSLSCETRTTSYSDDSQTRTIQNPKDTVSSSVNLKYHDAPVEIPHLPPSNDSDGRTLSSGPSRIGSIDEVPFTLEGNQSKMSHPTRTLYYPNLEKCVSLEADLQDFVSSLFWVLESKRLVAMSNIDKDRQPFLCAPFERKDLIGMDLESRTHRKRSVGRWRKQVGDLAFQAGLAAEALEHYQIASDILRPVNDWLWLAGTFEGLCAASVTLLFPHLRRPAVIQRIGSLTGESFTARNRSNSSGAGTMRSLPPDLDSTQNFLKNRFKFKYCLGPDEVLEKYHEAVVHYSKYRNAGVVETEASIKAVHVLIEQKKYLAAAEFLQNVVFINLQLSDEEKVHRFTALSELYNQLGFRRKSSFFRRVSAMRCVAPMTSMQPNWTHCYQLLLDSIQGYKLSLDPVLISFDEPCGWPALQVQILQELTGTARRLGNVPLAIRHAALLVHLLMIQQQQGATSVLSSTEMAEMAKQLEQLSLRSETPLHPGPLALENGTIIPPVSLTLLPNILSFKLQPPDYVLAAQKLVPDEEINSGPFLFTPIQFGSFRKQLKRKHQAKMDFQWIEGDHCEIVVQVENPAPFELRISQMQLLTEDVEFETEPVSFLLPPSTENQPSSTTIILSGVPRSSGLLKVVGYSLTVLGLKNSCKLKNVLPSSPFFLVQVVPALPRLQVQVISPNDPTNLVESQTGATARSIQLYAGQSTECSLTLINTSPVPVECFDLELVQPIRSASNQVFSFSIENLKAQLPWQPGSAASVTVYIHGASDFLSVDHPILHDGHLNLHSSEEPNSIPSVQGTPSIFSRLTNHSSVMGSPRNKAKRTESVISARSANSSIRSGGSGNGGIRNNVNADSCVNSKNLAVSTPVISKPVAALLKLQYSGGPGYAAGFCRSTSVSICVDILPSVIITKWDVLPAETPSHCYLVLDILNATSQEMELYYSSTKHIAIEALDSCRIPVPVERCPLVKLTHIYTENDSSPEQQLEEIAKICSEHLASLVELKWTLSGSAVAGHVSSAGEAGTSDRIGAEQYSAAASTSSPKVVRGKALLGSLRILPSMLDLLHISPIQLEIKLNNELWSPERAEFGCIVGDVVDIQVVLVNALSISLGPLSLQIVLYQDLQNGTLHRRLDTRVLFVGSDSAILEKVKANDNHVHRCSVAFFTSGSYKLDVICTLLQLQSMEKISKVHQVFQEATNHRHVWKLIPPIEFTIAEN